MESSGQEKLLEPIKYYKIEFREKFLKEITTIFEDLFQKSNIDIEANRKSVQEYHDFLKGKSMCEHDLKWLKRLSKFVIFLIVVLVFIEISMINTIYASYSEKMLKVIGNGLFIISLMYFDFQYISRIIKNLAKKIDSIEEEANLKKAECYSQVEPLLQLFESGMANKIISEIIPTLNVDYNFKMERYADLVENYGMFFQLDDDMSAKDIISGDILGNPFIIVKSIKNYVVNHRYEGSRTVTWTEYYTDYNGKRQSRTKTEVLYASVVKPKQIFTDVVTLIYANDASRNLTFSRSPHFIHKLSPRKLKNHIKKQTKLIKKKSNQAISKGESFLEMGNLEFDALFNAVDRDNEVEFRVLFTPIAQKNMIELLKNEEFGDDFSFIKHLKLNIIDNEKDWILNIFRSHYRDFSYDIIKEKFFKLNTEYFDNFYRLFLPIFAIPVYHQHKTKDYIYQDNYDCNYNPYVSEIMANLVGHMNFSHSESETPAILKTTTIESSDDTDLVMVTSDSYKKIQRVEYVAVWASNGKLYNVPVPWIEYIPLSSSGNMKITHTTQEEKEFEGKNIAYRNNIIAYPFGERDEGFDGGMEYEMDRNIQYETAYRREDKMQQEMENEKNLEKESQEEMNYEMQEEFEAELEEEMQRELEEEEELEKEME